MSGFFVLIKDPNDIDPSKWGAFKGEPPAYDLPISRDGDTIAAIKSIRPKNQLWLVAEFDCCKEDKEKADGDLAIGELPMSKELGGGCPTLDVSFTRSPRRPVQLINRGPRVDRSH